MSHTLDQLLNLLLLYKYLIIFPIAVLEGPGLSILVGVLIARGILNPFLSYGLLILGDTVGDTMYYCLGRFGGHPILKKWGHRINVTEAHLAKLEHHFHYRAPAKTLILGKTQPWGAAILFAAGTAKMKYLKFMGLNTIATIPKTLILVLLGYYFNQAYVALNSYIEYTGITLAVIAIPIIIYFFFRKRATSAEDGLATSEQSEPIKKP